MMDVVQKVWISHRYEITVTVGKRVFLLVTGLKYLPILFVFFLVVSFVVFHVLQRVADLILRKAKVSLFC